MKNLQQVICLITWALNFPKYSFLNLAISEITRKNTPFRSEILVGTINNLGAGIVLGITFIRSRVLVAAGVEDLEQAGPINNTTANRNTHFYI